MMGFHWHSVRVNLICCGECYYIRHWSQLGERNNALMSWLGLNTRENDYNYQYNHPQRRRYDGDSEYFENMMAGMLP